MAKSLFGETFSAGLGLALGLTMAQFMFQTFRLPEKVVKQVVVCPKCGSRNPVENRFCGQCGQALYPPPPPIQCPKCGVPMPQNLNFCWRCGSPLRKMDGSRKRESEDFSPAFLHSCRRTSFQSGFSCRIWDR